MDNKRYENLNGDISVFAFSDFLPSQGNSVARKSRVLDFMVTGPFVLKTDGAFETEHMYEREKILSEDYMASDGGEANAVPYIGKKVRNLYYGKEYLEWKKGFIKWDALRFDDENSACDDALYATEQRNAVYYAAFYVDCEKEEAAVISYDNSGSLLYLNGEMIDCAPFGRVKGLWNTGRQKAVRFQKGRNCIMFKIRPGYIADTMDISMPVCCIFPAAITADDVFLTYPSETNVYMGTAKSARRMLPAFAASLNGSAGSEIKVKFFDYEESIPLPPLNNGECSIVRFSAPCEKEYCIKKASVTLLNGSNKAEATYDFPVPPYNGFEGTSYIMSDFHFDTTYHQEQRTYALGAFHITKRLIENLIENPDFKATLSEIDYLHPYYTIYPEHREALRAAFASGRAEADCFYNQPNDLTSSGEAFVRNLIYGQLYHRDVLGRICSVYAPGDVFGHTSQLSQICKKGGCESIAWGKHMLGVDRLFKHVSPDGSYLVHNKGFGRDDALRFKLSCCEDSGGARVETQAYPRTGDTSWMKNTVSHDKFAVLSDISHDILESDAKNIAADGMSTLDFTSRDITQHHSGVLLTRNDFKQANRLCENLLTAAEKLAALCFLYGAQYPEKALDKAWRQLLCAQHHDSVTGTNNEVSFVDLMIQYREAAALAYDVLMRSGAILAGASKTDGMENPVAIFNTHAHKRSGRCFINADKNEESGSLSLYDAQGKEFPLYKEQSDSMVFIADNIPAVGMKLYSLKASSQKHDIIYGTDEFIENAAFKLRTDASLGGGIVSLYDKKTRREVIDLSCDGPANRIVVLRELHNRMETQHELYTTGQKLFSSDYKAEIRSEKCAAYQKLIITVKLDIIARAVQEITLYKGSDRVEIKTVIEDYQGEDDLFAVTFPVNIKGGMAAFDDRFAAHVSTKSKKKLSFQTHQYASFSGCRIMPANQWFGLGKTLTVTLGGKSSFNMGMTALIRKETSELIKISDGLLFSLTKKNIPVTQYSDSEKHGGAKIISFNEDVYSTDTRIVLSVSGDGNKYAEKLKNELSSALSNQFGKLLDKNGYAFLYCCDSDNVYHKPVDVILIEGLNAQALSEATAVISHEIASANELFLTDCVCAGKAHTADSYSAVLINKGTIASSVEGDNMLCMQLFHTASFYGNAGKVTGKDELVPEQKTHEFSYAFYPFSGGLLDSAVYKTAYEVNDPLFAVIPDKNQPKLFGSEKSFLKCSDDFVVTAFKAGGYPMASLKGKTGDVSSRGLTLRGFFAGAKDGKAVIETGFDLLGASSTDLLDEKPLHLTAGKNRISLPASANSIYTVNISPIVPRAALSGETGDAEETVQPVYVRSWEHDMGSMPVGYLSFAAVISKAPSQKDELHYALKVNAVNNMSDTDVSTKIRVSCSASLSVDKSILDADIKAGDYSVFDVNVTKAAPESEGQIRIDWEYDSQHFFDVYEIGCFNPEVKTEIQGSKIICTVKNPTAEHLTGLLALATPFETWSLPQHNCDDSLSTAAFERAVEAEPFSETVFEFEAARGREDVINSFWAAAKLCVNGRIHFGFDSVKGARHNMWAHEFINEIEKDNGSIIKLLEM